jgi:hypothetical protein
VKEEKLEDAKGILRSRKSKDNIAMAIRKRITGQTVIYKTLHRKEKIKQHHITPRYS